MQLSPEQVKSIKDGVQKIVSHVKYQAQKNDAQDIPEFLASEIIDLVEYCSESPDLQKPVASAVLKSERWAPGTEGLVKKYFSLPY